MEIKYYDDKLINSNIKSIFLAGPTPRSSEVESWRPQAIELLKELNFDGEVFVPEYKLSGSQKISYEQMIEWEIEHRKKASIIFFWIPRELNDMPAFTTNIEFGNDLKTGKIVYARPNDAPKNKYLDYIYQKEYNKQPYQSLFDGLKECVEKLKPQENTSSSKKCLIISGSPKKNGNTAKMIDMFLKNYDGEVVLVDCFKNISPCIDCGYCTKNPKCAIDDDFSKIIRDDYQTVVIASPIYMANLPGPLLNLISRFNFVFNSKNCLKVEHNFKPKRAILLLVGGGFAPKSLQGEFDESNALNQSKFIFKKLNASLCDDDTIVYLKTDEQPVCQNVSLHEKIAQIAKSCSEE